MSELIPEFYFCTQQKYDALEEKSDIALYFTTDTFNLYKGEHEYAGDVSFVESLPEVGVQGVLYIDTVKLTLHSWTGESWKQMSKSYATSISDEASDDNIPTEKAVADYVKAKIAGGGIDPGDIEVKYTKDTGTLEVAGKSVVLDGLVNKPSYDDSQRIITLPILGEDALVINIGKDNVVSSGRYDDDQKAIILVLANESEITIPVGSLVPIYTGLATSSAKITISEDKQVSVDVQVSVKDNNKLTLESDGLYVGLDVYLKSEVDEKITDVTQKITTHTEDEDSHVTKQEKEKWDAMVTSTQLEEAKTAAINDSKQYTDEQKTALEEKITKIETAITWKEIT